ncbi:MAG: hypothetical protein ACFFAS_08970 [Promethearchaeota archaeon]
MSKKIDTSGQFIEFYKKKGDYLVELSNNHFMNKEYKKCLELLSQAYAMYDKGGASELAEQTKTRFSEIKAKHFGK